MPRLDSALKEKNLLILDGSMASLLERKGLDLNDKLWSAKALIEKPELVKAVHYDYFVSGADCTISASYQATVPGFVEKGFTEAEAEALIARSVELLCEARDEWWEKEGKAAGRVYPLAAGAVGPYGAYLANGSEYTGDYSLSEEEYRAFHLPRMRALKNAGADILAVETIPKLEEAVVCAKIAQELQCDCWVTFTFRNSHQISEGTEIEEVARALKGIDSIKAVGVNCTHPEYVSTIIRSFKSLLDLPVLVYPNRGEKYDPVTKTWHGDADGKTFGDWSYDWYKAGASVIGGCCRTLPEDIEQIVAWYDKVKDYPRLGL